MDALAKINSLSKEVREALATAILQNKEIDAIKIFRRATNCSLKEGYMFIHGNWNELRTINFWRQVNG
jgi:hypothetical protein